MFIQLIKSMQTLLLLIALHKRQYQIMLTLVYRAVQITLKRVVPLCRFEPRLDDLPGRRLVPSTLTPPVLESAFMPNKPATNSLVSLHAKNFCIYVVLQTKRCTPQQLNSSLSSQCDSHTYIRPERGHLSSFKIKQISQNIPVAW